MEKIPILKLEHYLLVSIQVDLYDQLALNLRQELAAKVYATQARGILIDISTVNVVDSFMGRVINSITQMAKVMGATTVVVGMQPAVAITLVELGLTLQGVHTALNVEKGMAWLRRHIDDETGNEEVSRGGTVPERDYLSE